MSRMSTQVLLSKLNENQTMKNIPEYLSYATEFQDDVLVREPDEVGRLFTKLTTQNLMKTPATGNPQHFQAYKTNVLLHGYLCRPEVPDFLTANLLSEMNSVVSRAVYLSERALELSLIPTQMWRLKRLAPIQSIIHFEQRLVQGLWGLRDDPFYQFSFLTPAIVRKIKSPSFHQRSFLEFVKASEKRGLDDLYDDEKEDIRVLSRRYPQISLEVSISTNGEETIEEGDICTCKVTMTRENLEAGELAGPIYAPEFPVTLPEKWYFLLVDPSMNHRIVNMTLPVIEDNHRTSTTSFQIPAHFRDDPPKTVQHLTLELHAYCNGYLGLDVVAPVPLAIHPHGTAEKALSEDDQKILENYNPMMSYMGLPDSSSESSSDESDAEKDSDASLSDSDPEKPQSKGDSSATGSAKSSESKKRKKPAVRSSAKPKAD